MAYESQQRVEIAFPTPAKFLTKGVVIVLSLMIAGYALLSYRASFVLGVLVLDPSTVWQGHYWQLVTYSLVNGGCNLAFEGLFVLFLGSAIEREWGTRSFLLLWLVVGVTCALLWILVSQFLSVIPVAYGSSPCTYGLVGAYGLLFYRRRLLLFFWAMEAQHLALLLVAIGLVIGIAQPIMWVWVAGAGVAYLYIKLIWQVRSGSGISLRSAPSRGRFKDL